jgi:hypothetical protein
MHVRLQYSEVSYYFHIQQVANIKCLICEVLQKSLKVWVKCDYFETFHIEMHVHTSNLNTGPSPPLPFLQRLLMTLEGNEMSGCCRSPKDCSVNMLIMHLCSDKSLPLPPCEPHAICLVSTNVLHFNHYGRFAHLFSDTWCVERLIWYYGFKESAW